MEQFSVKISGLNQRISEQEKIEKSLSGIESSIYSVRSGLSMEIKSKQNLENILKQLAQQVNQQESDVRKMRQTLGTVKNEYERTERQICGYKDDHSITWQDILSAISIVGTGFAVSALFPALAVGWLVNTIVNNCDVEIKNEAKTDVWKHKRNEVESAYFELEDGKVVEKEKPEESEGDPVAKYFDDIHIWEATVSKEASLLHAGTEGESEWGNYSASADVLKAEAHAGVYASLAGVGAEVGASVTALSAEAKGQLGNDNLGVHGKAGVDVGKVEAKGEVNIGIVDKDGNINPQFGAKVSAEALLAEASGEVGVDLLGTDINVGGSVNFGVGAHADVGFQNGVLSFDVGASLGVGASVNFSVDMSGTVETVMDFASDVGDVAVEVSAAAGEFIGETVSNVSDFAGDMAESTGKFLSKGWKSITSLW